MKTSIIIVTKNRPILLKRCLNSLLQQLISPNEIILIDSSDSNKTQQLFSDYLNKYLNIDWRYKKVSSISIAYSRNQGIQLAKNNIIAFIDDDCVPQADWLKKIINFHQNNSGIDIVGGDVKNYKKNNYWAYVDSVIMSNYLPSNKRNTFTTHLMTCNFSLKKDSALKTGLLFDENMTALEDNDFCIRAQNRGLRVSYDHSIVVYHDYRTSLFSFINQWFFYGKGSYELYKKHSQKTLFSYIFIHVFGMPQNKKAFLGILISDLCWITGILYQSLFLKISLSLFSIIRSINRRVIEISRKYHLSNAIGFPVEVFIEPTNLCNARCPLCPTGAGLLKRPKGYMSLELFKKIIDEIKYYTQIIYLWNLGEPFLNKDIYSIISYAKRYNIYVISSTNGYALYEKSNIIKLIESGLDRLIIGMDGTDARVFNYYRKNVIFNKVIKGLEILTNEKIHLNSKTPFVDYQFILMKHNQHQLEKAKSIAEKYKMHFLIKYASLEMVNTKDKTNFLPDEVDQRIYKILKNQAILKRPLVNKPCVAWDGIVINWNGTVNPCIFDYYSNIILGDISKQKIIEIWRSTKLKKLKSKIINNRKDVLICNKCPIIERYSEEFFLYD